jgi:hypothetical protein
MLTPEDLAQMTAIFTAAELRINARTEAAEAHTVEAMRDMQTEILKGIEAFARGNPPRRAAR